VLAAQIHELEAGPTELFGEPTNELSDYLADDDIHGQFILEGSGIIQNAELYFIHHSQPLSQVCKTTSN
jgi:hypothetical protein